MRRLHVRSENTRGKNAGISGAVSAHLLIVLSYFSFRPIPVIAVLTTQDKSEGYIGRVPPLAASLQRAKNASIEQAVSGALFSSGDRGRFARGVRVAATTPSFTTSSTSAGDSSSASVVANSSAGGTAGFTSPPPLPDTKAQQADGRPKHFGPRVMQVE